MKIQFALGLALLTGLGLGGAVVQRIHAQVRPPAYVIAEIDVANEDSYTKEYVPAGSKAVLDAGAKYLARGTRTTAFKGEPPKRIVLLSFENFEKAQATFTSPAFLDAAKIGGKYAKFRIMQSKGCHRSSP
jgi:uncharacterized protein (DUF1330 family)